MIDTRVFKWLFPHMVCKNQSACDAQADYPTEWKHDECVKGNQDQPATNQNAFPVHGSRALSVIGFLERTIHNVMYWIEADQVTGR